MAFLRTLALALGAAAALSAAPALAATPRPTPSPSPSYSLPPSTVDAEKEVQRQQKAMTSESAILAKASARAAATLEAYQQANRQAQAATTEAISQSVRATSALKRTTLARRELLGFARSLYRTGMVDSSMLILTDALSAKHPQQLFGGLGLVKRVSTTRTDAVTGLAAAEAEQSLAESSAQSAAATARATSTTAAQAKKAADAVVAMYAHQVTARRIALARTTNTLTFAKLREANLKRAYDVARDRGWVPDAATVGAKAERDAVCKGQDVSGYPNGEIPSEALCPVWGVKGHRLRADAAAAFSEMAKEYAANFGAPICVTDSYRGFGAQVAVKIEKPDLAATPGLSNHGWGLATDLCDGIQTFGSATHNWMQANSMIYGWFHPAWAEQGGSKPEAWHWEFAG